MSVSHRSIAGLRASSFNETDNTIDVIWSCGSRVRRRSWIDGAFDEELDMSKAAVRLERLNAGAAFLNTHDAHDLNSVIGAVVRGSARIEKGKGVAKIQLSRSPEDQSIVQKIRDRVINNISVGYNVHRVEKTEGQNGDVPLWRVVDWEPVELSAVAVPADPGAQVRHMKGNISMNDDDDNDGDVLAERALAADETELQTRVRPSRRKTAVEKERVASIERLADRLADHDGYEFIERLADRHILDGSTETQFRAAVLRELESSPVNRATGTTRVGHGGPTESVAAAVESEIYSRLCGKGGRRLIDLGADLLRAGGARVDYSRPNQVFDAMMTRSPGSHSSSDFPLLLANVMSKRLGELFRAAESGVATIAVPGSVPDFKTFQEVRLSSFPELVLTGEHAEIKFGTLDEEGESGQIASYARGISITFAALVNDDLTGIERSIRDIGFAAAELKAKLIIAALGVTMRDGQAVFSAAHANVAASGAPPSVTTLSAGRLAMRKQTAIDGVTPLGIAPKILVVPSELETLGDSLTTAINPIETGAVNPFANKLTVAVEARFASAAPWYLFADPAVYPVIRFLTLAGFESPRLETQNEFDKLGSSYRVHWHCGAAPIDYRGGYRNAGA